MVTADPDAAAPRGQTEGFVAHLPGVDGTVVAITGGASGIGRAAALLVAAAGARVVVGDLRQEPLEALGAIAEARHLPISTTVLDVSDRAATEAFVATAAEDQRFGGLVCSAGIAPDVDALSMTWQQWDRVIDVNLGGTFAAVQTAARALTAAGRGGSIVTIGSAVGTTGAPGLSHYAASKGAVVAVDQGVGA